MNRRKWQEIKTALFILLFFLVSLQGNCELLTQEEINSVIPGEKGYTGYEVRKIISDICFVVEDEMKKILGTLYGMYLNEKCQLMKIIEKQSRENLILREENILLKKEIEKLKGDK